MVQKQDGQEHCEQTPMKGAKSRYMSQTSHTMSP